MLIRVVKAVSLTNRQRLIEVFLRAVRLRFTRSRCVALSWLASLACAHLRPANCSQFANQSLAPVLELLAAEDEEDVHKTLAAALARLLPVLGRYYELSRLKALLDILLPKLLGGTDARSRSVAASLCCICLAPTAHSLARSPGTSHEDFEGGGGGADTPAAANAGARDGVAGTVYSSGGGGAGGYVIGGGSGRTERQVLTTAKFSKVSI